MAIERIILVNPRGFCAGVDRAIKVVEDCITLFGRPVYVKHDIVHNKHVVKQLTEKGAVTVEDPDEVPEGSVIVFSAHGSPPAHYGKARKLGLRIIDATCPLVAKVHLEVHRYAKEGFTIIYIGHKKHVEGIGVLGELPEKIPIVESVADVGRLDIGNPEKMIYLTQTTLSIDDTAKIVSALRKRYPQLIDPPKEDICYATTNRQAAIKELAKRVDCTLVVGSVNSSNSQRLVETAKACGVKAFLVDDFSGIKQEWLNDVKTLGISAGASAPERLVQEIVSHFVKKGAKKQILEVIDEKMKFSEPQELARMRKEAKL
ncbi:MAG TPA: 4-hydroxy-3-methylbut-2-enyl diphosphate reductase [Candidatus Nanoarchaeia archaeon]|nr:4-hydroxy-3-methylbut-2-enyl diphosphate reductase [Candidatus Nanoarchaeia archaeon]